MRILLLIVFSVFFAAAYAQKPAQIIGKSVPLRGQVLLLAQPSDFLFESDIIIDRDTVQPDGSFSFTIPTDSLRIVYILYYRQRHTFYVEPGVKYRITIPDEKAEYFVYDLQNDTTKIYHRISQLNYDFNNFTIDNYEKFVTGEIKKMFVPFADSMATKYAPIAQQNSFFEGILTYKIADFLYTSRGKGPKYCFETYLKNKPVLYTNPEYMYFFKTYYDGHIADLYHFKKSPSLYFATEYGRGFDSLLIEFTAHPNIGSRPLAELYAVNGLIELYFKTKADRTKLEQLFTEATQANIHPQVQRMAQNFLKHIGRLRPGAQAPDFAGERPDGTLISSTNLMDKPIYLSFFHPQDPNSIRQIPAIRNLYDKYKKNMHFVSICTGCRYNELDAFIKEHQLKWFVLTANSEAENAYEVMELPAYFIIEKGGKFFQSPAKSPADGVEEYIYNLTQKVRIQR